MGWDEKENRMFTPLIVPTSDHITIEWRKYKCNCPGCDVFHPPPIQVTVSKYMTDDADEDMVGNSNLDNPSPPRGGRGKGRR